MSEIGDGIEAIKDVDEIPVVIGDTARFLLGFIDSGKDGIELCFSSVESMRKQYYKLYGCASYHRYPVKIAMRGSRMFIMRKDR